MIIINSNTRQFNVPGADLVFGVVADSDAERKFFQCPRYVGDGLDLAACFIRINYRNANGKTDFYLVDDMVIDGDNITFSWLLSPKVTEYRGQVKFVMCAVGPDLKLKWHTTQGTGQVMDGLEPDNSHVESQTADVVAQLIDMVEAQTTAVEKVGADQVAAVKATAKTAQDSAVTAIETAGTAVKASIPTDYTALSDAMRRVAPGIECFADGNVITLSDASDNPLRSLRIFGKSTQDGTPTPESPAEVVSVGDDGSVDVIVCGKNLLNMLRKTETKSGVTWIAEGSVLTISGTTEGIYGDIICKNFRIDAGTYVVSFKNLEKLNRIELDCAYEDGTKVFAMQYVTASKPSFTFTAKERCYVSMTFVINSGTAFGNENNPTFIYAQIEEGSKVTEYEPYKEQNLTISTPNGLPGIPVSSGGNCTDANGQQWICDEVDFERGVYVQRVALVNKPIKEYRLQAMTNQSGLFQVLDFEAMSLSPLVSNLFVNGDTRNVNYTISTDRGDNDFSHFYYSEYTTVDELISAKGEDALTIIYVIRNPIETPLSETELAAYRAMHTNKPNTTIINDSGAYMFVDYTADTKLYIDNKIKEALL